MPILMARIARVIAPGFPHHVTQRGNRRQQTFFCDDDYQVYVDLLREQCLAHGVLIWGWCLMPNHAHLIAVPASETGLRLAIGNTHWRYTRHVNFREKWRGYLWQGRFTSCPLDDEHLLAAARYVDRNPERPPKKRPSLVSFSVFLSFSFSLCFFCFRLQGLHKPLQTRFVTNKSTCSPGGVHE